MKVGDKFICKEDYWDLIDYYPDNDEKWGYRFFKDKSYKLVEIKTIGSTTYYMFDETYWDPEIIVERGYKLEQIKDIFYTGKELRKLKLREIDGFI